MAVSETKNLTAVADASFLIGLCLIDRFHLLVSLVERLYVAPAVWNEVVVRGGERPGAREVQNSPVVRQQEIQNTQALQSLRLFLGSGEAESIVLAQETAQAVLFADDLRARKAAQEAGIRTMGIAGFLLLAKQNGLLQEIYPLLKNLQEKGFRLSQAVIDAILKEADEDIPSEEA